MKKFTIMAITTLIFAIPIALFARWGNYCGPDNFLTASMRWGGFQFFNGGIFMFITTILITGLLVFSGYIFFKSKKIMDGYGQNPYDILKFRYAKGELSKEEFDRMRNDVK